MMSPSQHSIDGARAIINLGALRRNVAWLSALIAPSEVMLAVKADAYGHGLIPVARAGLEAGATSLAVLEVPVGLTLRDAGITAPLLAWLHGRETPWRAGIEADIELGISGLWQLDAIEACHAERPAVLHLKVDTGLSRNGATREDWPRLVERALDLERRGVVRIRAAWSHLADASIEDDRAALEEFHDAVAVAQSQGAHFELLHLAASSAGIRMPEARFDHVRFGIAAYGFSPFDDADETPFDLEPVMSVDAPVLEVTDEYVTVAFGYADGLPPNLSRDATVTLNGAALPIIEVGCETLRVLRGGTEIQPGDRVTIFGTGERGDATAGQFATWAQTIADEMITGVSERVPRLYIDEERARR